MKKEQKAHFVEISGIRPGELCLTEDGAMARWAGGRLRCWATRPSARARIHETVESQS